jgi:putative tryptophan/tyrosine transport system substrate-binding protein
MCRAACPSRVPYPLYGAQGRPPGALAAQPIEPGICDASKIPSCEAAGGARVERISARVPVAWEALADEPGRQPAPIFLDRPVMERRTFLAMVSGSLLAAPRAAEGQGMGKVPRIGVLSSAPSATWDGFRQGLRELGYTEDRTILIEWRWTEGKAERARELAAELVRLQPNVLVTSAPQPSAAAKAATAAIPIVFIAVADPVGAGLVAALARPGGNVTGLATLVGPGFTGKLIELLKEALPQVSRVAVLINPTNAIHQQIVANELPDAAERLRLTLFTVEARAAEALEGAFETAVRSRAGAILALGDPLVFVQRARIAELAAKHRLPAMYLFRESVEAGGLMAYGPSFHDLGRRAAGYVDKILKGAKPGDLPVEQPTKFELVINLKTAKALGLTIPPSLLARADQVIE